MTETAPPPGTDAATSPAAGRRNKAERNPTEEFLNVIGYVLGISYPLFGVSVLARGIVQTWFHYRPENAAWLDLVCAVIYFAAAVGFFLRSRWAWKLSVVALSLEIGFCLVVGTLSIFGLVGTNVWTLYGIQYGFIPTIQPILGLLWLRRTRTRIDYGLIEPGPEAEPEPEPAAGS